MSKWTPQDDQVALTLAAIRWYMLSLEKLANDIYITDRTKYEEVQAVLSRAFRDLAAVRAKMPKPKEKPADPKQYTAAAEKQQTTASFSDGCPPGYVNCGGVCLPDCDPQAAEY